MVSDDYHFYCFFSYELFFPLQENLLKNSIKKDFPITLVTTAMGTLVVQKEVSPPLPPTLPKGTSFPEGTELKGRAISPRE